MFLLKHRCQRNRSAINSTRLCAVSDQFRCESRLWNSARWVPKTLRPRQHLKESASRRMTFTSHGRDFKNKLPLRRRRCPRPVRGYYYTHYTNHASPGLSRAAWGDAPLGQNEEGDHTSDTAPIQNMAGGLFYTVFQQRPLIWARQSATLTGHTGDSITDLPWLTNTSWTTSKKKKKTDIYPPTPTHTKSEWTRSINTARCLHGVLCSVSPCRQTLSAFQQFLICAVRKGSLWVQPIPVAVIDQSEQTRLNSDANQQPETLLILTCTPGAAHQEMLTSYRWWTIGTLCLRCGLDSDGMRMLPTFISKYKAVVVSLIFISYLHFHSFSRKCENCEPLTVKSGQWKKVLFRFSPL